jgi:hypothetical protein
VPLPQLLEEQQRINGIQLLPIAPEHTSINISLRRSEKLGHPFGNFATALLSALH